MKDKLQTKIREAEEEHAGEILDAHLEASRQTDRDRAMFVLGGVNIADRVAASLSSEAIKALITFQEQRLYLALGFDHFVDFLNGSEYSPMTKQQFYDRKALLENEGEALFNLLTELGLSIRKRKLLGKGNIEMSGDVLIVHDGDQTTEIAIDDRSSILDAITALADANADKSAKLEKQKEKIAKHDEKVRELYADIDRVKAAKVAEFAADAHMTARIELGLSFGKFTDVVSNLSDAEKEQFRDDVLEHVAVWATSLRDAYRTGDGTQRTEPAVKGETFGEALTNFLDEADLDPVVNNDGELAAKL